MAYVYIKQGWIVGGVIVFLLVTFLIVTICLCCKVTTLRNKNHQAMKTITELSGGEVVMTERPLVKDAHAEEMEYIEKMK